MAEQKLSVRAAKALRAIGIRTPAELAALVRERGIGLEATILRIPNCGRKSLNEIVEWGRNGWDTEPPKVIFLSLVLNFNGEWILEDYSEAPSEDKGWLRYELQSPTAPR